MMKLPFSLCCRNISSRTYSSQWIQFLFLYSGIDDKKYSVNESYVVGSNSNHVKSRGALTIKVRIHQKVLIFVVFMKLVDVPLNHFRHVLSMTHFIRFDL